MSESLPTHRQPRPTESGSWVPCCRRSCRARATWRVPMPPYTGPVAAYTCDAHLSVPSDATWADAEAAVDRLRSEARAARFAPVGPGWVDDGAGCVEFIPEW